MATKPQFRSNFERVSCVFDLNAEERERYDAEPEYTKDTFLSFIVGYELDLFGLDYTTCTQR
jgi:hypothetical protein